MVLTARERDVFWHIAQTFVQDDREMDENKVATYLKRLYVFAGISTKPDIEIVTSPFEMQAKAYAYHKKYASEYSNEDKKDKQKKVALWSRIANDINIELKNKIAVIEDVSGRIRQISNNKMAKFDPIKRLLSQSDVLLRDKLRDQGVNLFELYAEVCDEDMEEYTSVCKTLKAPSFKGSLNSSSPVFCDIDHIFYYMAVCVINKLKLDWKIAGFFSFRPSIFDIIELPGKTFVCPFPKKFHWNDRFQLHSIEGHAVEWGDGTGLSLVNGVPVSDKLIFYPLRITKDELLSIDNVELRRAHFEALGPERFASLLDLEEFDREVDEQGHVRRLMRTKRPDIVAGNFLYFANVVCPSTLREYYIPVPPMQSIRAAVAWTFGKGEDEYVPVVET